MAADAHVVGNLHLIVDFGSFTNDSVVIAPRSIVVLAPIST